MPRAFVAIDLPEDIAETLQDIASGLPGVAWVPPHQYHLTLRFLGEVADHTFENILHGLRDIRAESFYIDLKGVGHFPLRGHPEVLWAGVALSEPLQRLRHRLESALTRAGMAPEGRKFHPHITLGRLKNSAAHRVGSYEVVHALFGVANIPVENFHLYTSRLSPEGAFHTLEATYPLDGILEGQSETEEENGGEAAVI